ncbi:MAG: hypothetical protein HY658_04865, partial [Actinobacteria bacterium]|nr:hypothetical protein [Actinomycetota bacterium]
AHAGVTVRRPFGDLDLWEYVLSLPAETKFPDARRKGLLRRVVRGLLPDEIVEREDKTVFDEYNLASPQYPTLRELLLTPDIRISGVDYAVVADRLAAEDMALPELRWARDLARVHAFLEAP